MTQDMQPEHLSKRVVVYRTLGMEAVRVRRDVPYQVTDAGALTLDIYYPPARQDAARTPAVVFVLAYSDLGTEALLGCKLKEMGAYGSWARLVAASGLIAITYTTREPAADIQTLLQYVRRKAADLGIDEDRVGLWACSGNVPLALSVLMREAREYVKCAVLCYGYMLDLEGANGVAEAAETFRFVNPCAGRSVDEFPRELPLFIARAGQDQMPRLNETIDRFMVKALSRNLPVTFVNHPTAPHAFDLFDESETSREIIRQILAYLRSHLLAAHTGSYSDTGLYRID